jgi:pyruvate kinase
MTGRPELRKTKIVATIGPACDAPELLKAMILAGMNVARLNLSHGTLDEHKQRLERIREVSEQIGANVAIMLDTRGIEVRTGHLQDGAAELVPGATFKLYAERGVGVLFATG